MDCNTSLNDDLNCIYMEFPCIEGQMNVKAWENLVSIFINISVYKGISG